MRAVVLGLALALLPFPALAEGPPGSPSPGPSPTPLPSPAPSPAPSPSAEPASATAEADPEAARLRQVTQAKDLSAQVDALGQLLESERSYVTVRLAEVAQERARATGQLAALELRISERKTTVDALLRQTYLASTRSPLELVLDGGLLRALTEVTGFSTLAADARRELETLRDLRQQRTAEQERLARSEADLAGLAGTLRAKERSLTALRARATVLSELSRTSEAAAFDAQAAVVQELLAEEIRSNAVLDELVLQALSAAIPGTATRSWSWPSAGVLSQPFGPSALALEPPRAVGGILFPHFHDALDLAAPFGSAVTAAAAGTVTFVGHLPDGAMVVVIAHPGELVSLYAHLDDLFLPPTVKAGDAVVAGQRIGAIGLTGITTGPHLHFAVRRGSDPIDPRTLLPTR